MKYDRTSPRFGVIRKLKAKASMKVEKLVFRVRQIEEICIYYIQLTKMYTILNKNLGSLIFSILIYGAEALRMTKSNEEALELL